MLSKDRLKQTSEEKFLSICVLD